MRQQQQHATELDYPHGYENFNPCADLYPTDMGLVRILGGLPVWMLNEDELWNALLYIDNHVLPCILVDVEI